MTPEELFAENDRLRAALKPFVEATVDVLEMAENLKEWNDERYADNKDAGDSWALEITYGDIRRAAAALKPK